MTTTRGLILPSYKASFAARLPVGGVMQCRVPMKPQPVIDTAYPKPPHKPGDVVFGKERWSPIPGMKPSGYFTDPNWIHRTAWYEVDNDKPTWGGRWLPANRMTAEHARLFFRVRSVRVERFFQITEADALAEGVFPSHIHSYQEFFHKHDVPAMAFGEQCWDKQYGKKYPWRSNPWVFVYELERTERP